MLPQSYNFSHGLCLNHLLQVFKKVIKEIKFPHSDILIGLMRCLIYLEEIKC